jgi:hypothetical protein
MRNSVSAITTVIMGRKKNINLTTMENTQHGTRPSPGSGSCILIYASSCFMYTVCVVRLAGQQSLWNIHNLPTSENNCPSLSYRAPCNIFQENEENKANLKSVHSAWKFHSEMSRIQSRCSSTKLCNQRRNRLYHMREPQLTNLIEQSFFRGQIISQLPKKVPIFCEIPIVHYRVHKSP